MTTHEVALHEFREASAAVRLAFSAVADAREKQIIANTTAGDASQKLTAAQERLDRADQALQSSRASPPAPADIDKAAGIAPVDTAAMTAPRPNGSLVVDPPAPEVRSSLFSV